MAAVEAAHAAVVGVSTRIMQGHLRLTAIIEREDDGFVALCPELDIASQGASIEEARANLVGALTLFFETASSSEIGRRVYNEVFVTQVEVPVTADRKTEMSW